MLCQSDPLLPDVVGNSCTVGAGTLVLEAEPGAGKTTRVPVALHQAGLTASGRIIVTEPRRTCRHDSPRASSPPSCRSPSGRTIGYSVRFEHVASKDTRILYVTEGVLLRRLMDESRRCRTSVASSWTNSTSATS